MHLAREQSGRSDFGDQSFVPALVKQLDCLTRDANFHAAGFQDFREQIIRDLANRLRFREGKLTFTVSID
jgi:hypothetical protein